MNDRSAEQLISTQPVHAPSLPFSSAAVVVVVVINQSKCGVERWLAARVAVCR